MPYEKTGYRARAPTFTRAKAFAAVYVRRFFHTQHITQ